MGSIFYKPPHIQNNQVRFKRDNNGLYIFKPPHIQNNQVCATNIEIDSIEENMKMFTTRQIQQAKLTRQVYQALGTPS